MEFALVEYQIEFLKKLNMCLSQRSSNIEDSLQVDSSNLTTPRSIKNNDDSGILSMADAKAFLSISSQKNIYPLEQMNPESKKNGLKININLCLNKYDKEECDSASL